MISAISPSTFGLHDDVLDAALDPEWCILVSQQARTLAGMLRLIQTAVARGQQRTDARRHEAAWLQALEVDTHRMPALSPSTMSIAAEPYRDGRLHLSIMGVCANVLCACWEYSQTPPAKPVA